MTEWFNIRACCNSPSASRIREPVVMPEDHKPVWTGPIQEVVAAEPTPRDPAIAAHEASHCVAVHALGGTIDRVSVDSIQQVVHHDCGHDPRERAIIKLAGDFGANWLGRWVSRPYDSDLLERISSFKLCEFGGCDQCQALLSIHSIVGGSHAPDREYLRVYREIEEATLAIVQRPAVMRAIRAVADALMENGGLDGEDAHALIDSYVPFGSIRMPKPVNLENLTRD